MRDFAGEDHLQSKRRPGRAGFWQQNHRAGGDGGHAEAGAGADGDAGMSGMLLGRRHHSDDADEAE